jgi:hypothetical protein
MVEDAISLQFALVQVIRALHDRAIDPKTAAINPLRPANHLGQRIEKIIQKLGP